MYLTYDERTYPIQSGVGGCDMTVIAYQFAVVWSEIVDVALSGTSRISRRVSKDDLTTPTYRTQTQVNTNRRNSYMANIYISISSNVSENKLRVRHKCSEGK